MGQWVIGQMGQQIWVGHVGYGTRDPRDPFYIVLIRYPT